MRDNLLQPYVGINDLNLYDTEDNIRAILKEQSMSFNVDVWDNRECSVQVPWTIYQLENGISLFFANHKLFKIVAGYPFEGKLSNGIFIGMLMDEAKKIDGLLSFNEWNEDYESPEGYWIEDDPASNTVLTLSVFIREIDDECFEKYQW